MPSDTDYKALVDRLDRAYDVVSALSQGRERWTMSVPPRPDADPDLVIGGALSAAKSAIEALQARAEAADARVARLEGAIREHRKRGEVCMCGSLMADHSAYEGHQPVSMRDHYADDADRDLYATLEDQG
jgi:hypothetical protein